MFFRGFRASLNLNAKKHYDAIEFESANPICGAYRMNGDEFYVSADNTSDITQQQSSFIFEPPPPLRPSKSTNDLTLDLPVTLRKKEVSTNPKGAEFEYQKQDRESRKTMIEIERLSKIKSELKQSNNKKSKAPAPPPLPIDTQSNNFTDKQSIIRIDSSIERSLKTTGPPPYALVSDKLEVIPNRNDMDTENVSFKNLEETPVNNRKSDGERSNIGQEPVARERKKKSFLDLNYNIENITIDSGAKEELV